MGTIGRKMKTNASCRVKEQLTQGKAAVILGKPNHTKP